MPHPVIMETLRAVRKDALETVAKHNSEYGSAFDEGRAHALRFALSLLDPSGPEAQELTAVCAHDQT